MTSVMHDIIQAHHHSSLQHGGRAVMPAPECTALHAMLQRDESRLQGKDGLISCVTPNSHYGLTVPSFPSPSFASSPTLNPSSARTRSCPPA